jgi:4-amino-4-deoxy-L-arabinose transferase-like glycosyltransferase
MHSVAANALDLRASTVRERTFYESRWPAVLWLILGCLMFASAWMMPMTRTQEARVLVTARETLESGTLEGWLIPRANGEVRLQKPPLAYWLSAASFKLFGINEAAGRLPMVLFAWLTVGLTYDLARRLLSTRAAFYAAAGMGASMLFWRFANHAETDGLAMFFVTLAVYAIWRAWLIELKGAKRGGSTIWLHVSAVAMALSGLSKGPPVVFPLMFLACFSWAAWRWDLLARFFTRGAFITLLVIVAPWFLYILANHSSGVIKEELAGLAKGKGHVKGPLYHFIALLIATLPWTPLVVGGVVIAVRQWQGYVRMRGLLLWIGCILIPLSLPSQKQDHYLLPILPPVFMLMGHLLDRALSGIDAGLDGGANGCFRGRCASGLRGPQHR